MVYKRRLFGWLAAVALAGCATVDEDRDESVDAIIGGRVAAPSDFPGVVSIGLEGIGSATATLLADNVLLTAAHVLIDDEWIGRGESVSALQPRGKVWLSRLWKGSEGVTYGLTEFEEIDSIELNPTIAEATKRIVIPVSSSRLLGFDNVSDLALVRFHPSKQQHTYPPNTPKFRELVRPARVGDWVIDSDTPITVAGYGCTMYVDSIWSSLSDGEYLKYFNARVSPWSSREMIRVWTRTSGMMCSGDSGGPVFAKNGAGEYVVVGAVKSPEPIGTQLFGRVHFDGEGDPLPWIQRFLARAKGG